MEAAAVMADKRSTAPSHRFRVACQTSPPRQSPRARSPKRPGPNILLNHRYQTRGHRRWNAILRAASHDGSGDAVELQLASCGQVFRHRGPHGGRKVCKDICTLRNVNLRALVHRHGRSLAYSGFQFSFPFAIRQDFAVVLAGCRSYQRKGLEKAELGPEQCSFASDKLALPARPRSRSATSLSTGPTLAAIFRRTDER